MRPLLATPLIALAACGGPLFSAEVEVDRFCFSLPAPADVPFVQAQVPVTSPLTVGPIGVPVKLPPLLSKKGTTLEVGVEELRLTAISPPGTDLSGVSLLRIETSSGLVASYTAPAAPARPLGTIVATGTGLDIAAAAKAGTLSVTVTAAGSPPQGPAGQSWQASLELCAHGRSVIPYF